MIGGSQRAAVKDSKKVKRLGVRRSQTRLKLEVSTLAVNSLLFHVPS